MAEYYPLLAKAVANLKEPTPESRRALYERARKALLTQLRNAQPPVPEEDIAREESALDAAAARVEGEATLKAETIKAEEERALSAVAASLAAEPPAPPVSPKPASVPPLPPPPLVRPPTLRPPTARPPAPPVVSSPPDGPEAPAVLDWSIPAGARPAAPAVEEPVKATSEEPARTNKEWLSDFSRPRSSGASDQSVGEDRPPVLAETRNEGVRPLAPVAAKSNGFNKRAGIFGGLLLVALAVLAGFAYKLREKPEDYAPVKPQVAEPVEPSAGKINGRVGEPATNVSKPASDSRPVTPSVTQPALPIAQRAALLVEAPDEPSKVKTSVGSVVWSMETGANGLAAIRGIASIPEAGVNLNILITKNTDPSIASTHRIEVRFKIGDNSPIGGVKQIAAPEMRVEDKPQGDALSGLPARVTDNYFWVALAEGDVVVERNLELLRDRGWFDIPILLTTDRIAKVTLEKGAIGDQLMRQAIESWAR